MQQDKTFIGELNERITIKSVVKIKSPTSGAPTSTMQVLKNCWSKVKDVSGTEEVEGRIVYVNTKEFTVRYDERLTGTGAHEKEIDYEGETYNIIDVSKIGRKRYLAVKGVKRD
ncbi:hypothetical protein ACIVBQ_000421 [Tenacibaculum discolor]